MKGSRMSTPKYATSECRLFWAEGNEDPADSEKSFTSPLTTYKNLDKGPGPEELLPETTYLSERSTYMQGNLLITKHLPFLRSCELSFEAQALSHPLAQNGI